MLAVYEYQALDACLERATSLGIKAVCDCLDGYLFLVYSFPAGIDRKEIFREISTYAQRVTGMDGIEIREKEIKLPQIPELPKPAAFEIKDYVDAGDAGKQNTLALMNRYFTTITQRSKAIVAEQIFFGGTDIVESTVVRTQDETLKIYQCCKITLTVNGKTVEKQVMAWWLDQKDRKICRDIDFLTTSVARAEQPHILSSFTGLYLDTSQRVDFIDAEQHAGVRLVLRHVLRILANNNLAVYDYILNSIANALQTRTKPGVILCILGDPGVGKSFLFYPSGRNTPILRTIYGGRRGFDTLPYMGAGDVTQLTARFNLTQGNKLVCVLDEVGQKSTRIVMDQLKHLAGSERVQIEAKHLDACNMFDPRFFIFLSNHGDAFKTDGDTDELSRKFFITEASDEFSQAKRRTSEAVKVAANTYFAALEKAQNDPETVHHFFWYLMQRDVSTFDPFDQPATASMTELRAAGNAVPDWFNQWSDGTWAASTAHDRDPFHSQFGTDDDNYDNEVDPHAFTAAFFKTKTLEAIFKLWARDNMPDSFTMTADKFASKLAKFARDSTHLLKATNRRQARGYTIQQRLPPAASPLGSLSPV